MHKNVIEGLEAAGCPLQHVYFNAGGKWYGKILRAVIYVIKCYDKFDLSCLLPPLPYMPTWLTPPLHFSIGEH